MKFKVLLEKDVDGVFVATVPSLPGCISQGKTEAEAISNIREAIDLHITSLAGEGIPLPSASKKVKAVEVAFPA